MQSATATTEMPRKKTPPAPRNGVDTPALLATIGVVAGQPELANFRFRARNVWLTGTHSRTTMTDFAGAGTEHSHIRAYTADGDHPTVLCGADQAPTPVEWVLHALASCLTAGIGNIAAARGVTLHRVESTVEGDIDLQGILGLSDKVRNGYERIKVTFDIAGDAPPEKLRQIVEQAFRPRPGRLQPVRLRACCVASRRARPCRRTLSRGAGSSRAPVASVDDSLGLLGLGLPRHLS